MHTNNKHCPSYKANKKAFWTHNSADCFYKDENDSVGTANSRHAMKKLKASNNEMEKKLKKMSKKVKALNRECSSSDSDSD